MIDVCNNSNVANFIRIRRESSADENGNCSNRRYHHRKGAQRKVA